MIFHGENMPDGVSVLGWTVYSPESMIRTVSVPQRRGMIRTGGKLGARSVVVRMVIDENNTDKRIAIVDDLNRWLYTDGPAPLYLTGRVKEYLMAECDKYADPNIEAYGEEFEISFICQQPEYIGAQLMQKAYASGDTIRVGGALPTPVQIRQTFSGKVTDPSWTLNRRVIVALEGDVPAGTVEIDTETGTVMLDGEDITAQASLDSDLWMQLAPGSYQWAPSITTGSPTISWRERKL